MDDELEIDVLMPCEAWGEAVPGAQELCRQAAVAAFQAGIVGSPFFESQLSRTRLAFGVEMGVSLGDDALVRQLNRDYRGQDRTTNVLSFAALDEADGPDADDQQPLMLGDIVIAFETTRAEAQTEAIPLAHHLIHLVVHGVLHLLGYDHEDDVAPEKSEMGESEMGESETGEEIMEGLETAILASLDIPDPYAPFTHNDIRNPIER